MENFVEINRKYKTKTGKVEWTMKFYDKEKVVLHSEKGIPKVVDRQKFENNWIKL